MLEANCVAMTRPLPWWPITRCMMRCSTEASLVVRPGDSTLVESLMNNVAPSFPVCEQECEDTRRTAPAQGFKHAPNTILCKAQVMP